MTAGILPTNHYAGFWRRFVGWFIDMIVLFALIIFILNCLTALVFLRVTDPIPPLSISSLSEQFDVVSSSRKPILSMLYVAWLIIGITVMALYYSLLESSSLQGTIGKYIVGLKITTIEGSRISFITALIRRIYSSLLIILGCVIGYMISGFTNPEITQGIYKYIVSSDIGGIIGGIIGGVAAGFAARKQTFYDMLVKTVVTVNKPIKIYFAIGIVAVGIVILCTNVRIHGPKKYVIEQQERSEVSPLIREAIIATYLKRKALFVSEDFSHIRHYILNSVSGDSKEITRISTMSDSDLQKIIGSLNHTMSLVTEDMLSSSDAVWKFSDKMDRVEIRCKRKDSTTNTNYMNTVTVGMSYTNGQWY